MSNQPTRSFVPDSPCTLVYDTYIPGALGKLDIVAKPVDESKRAFREIGNLREALSRGIPCVEPVAVVETPNAIEQALVISALRHGLSPIASINLQGLNNDNNDHGVKDLMSNLGNFLAECQKKGFFHNDLHPGNIGLDLGQGRSNSFVLFDLEKAELMNPRKLMRVLDPFQNKRVPRVPVQIERKFLGDAANLVAGVVTYNPRVNEEIIKAAFLAGYFGNSQLYARYPDHFNQQFEDLYPYKKAKQEKVLKRRNKTQGDTAA